MLALLVADCAPLWEVKPPKVAPVRTPDQLWADLAGEPGAAFRAVWAAAAHPECPKAFREKLPPAPDDGAFTPEHWRQKRAVLVMELSGTPESRGVLKEWVGGAPGAVLIEDAKASLARLDAVTK